MASRSSATLPRTMKGSPTMPASSDRHGRLLREAHRSLGRVEDLIRVAQDVQWSKARTPSRPGGDATIRSKGQVSDPTGETATDPKRLQVRQELQAADRALLIAVTALQGTEAALARAVEAWGGGPIDTSEPPPPTP